MVQCRPSVRLRVANCATTSIHPSQIIDLPLLRWASTDAALLLLFVAVADIIAVGRHGWQAVLLAGGGGGVSLLVDGNGVRTVPSGVGSVLSCCELRAVCVW